MAVIKVGKKDNFEFIVDDDKIEYLSKFNWNVKSSHDRKFIYAQTVIDGKRIPLHRVIISAKPGEIVDHIDGNTFNNKIDNLRICSMRENNLNRKPHKIKNGKKRLCEFKGVYFRKRNNIFETYAHCHKTRRRKYLGSFKDPKVAAKEYDNFVKQQNNEFMRTNER